MTESVWVGWPVELHFNHQNGARVITPTVLAYFGVTFCVEYSCRSSSHCQKHGTMAFNGSPGRAVISSYHREAIFGFQILILSRFLLTAPFIQHWYKTIHHVLITRLGVHVYLGAFYLCYGVLVNNAIIEPRF